MNYQECLDYLESLSPTTQKPCLERVAEFMRESGQQQDRFESIHVGGTNGKGSTVAMLDAVLRGAGLRVGRFTGPHLLRWNERFHVDGKPIGDAQFAELATRVRRMSESFGRRNPEFGALTWFEFLTAMAFFHFAEQGVEVAVVEVGLGGRWDATNVLSAPLAVAITNVDLDHTQILGDTVRAIALEKSGIIKRAVPVVTAAAGEAFDVVARTASDRGAPLYCCRPPDAISLTNGLPASAEFNSIVKSGRSALLDTRNRLSLAGSHQQMNALVALGLLIASGMDKRLPANSIDIVGESFAGVFWPGRLQRLPAIGLVFDGAHNPAGALALRRALDEQFPDTRMLFVLGCFQNKDAPSLIGNLVRAGDRVFACEVSTRRPVCPAASIAQLSAGAGAVAAPYPSVASALGDALARRRGDEIVVATGSFATVKEGMLHLGWTRVEDGRPETSMIWQPAQTPVAGLSY